VSCWTLSRGRHSPADTYVAGARVLQHDAAYNLRDGWSCKQLCMVRAKTRLKACGTITSPSAPRRFRIPIRRGAYPRHDSRLSRQEQPRRFKVGINRDRQWGRQTTPRAPGPRSSPNLCSSRHLKAQCSASRFAAAPPKTASIVGKRSSDAEQHDDNRARTRANVSRSVGLANASMSSALRWLLTER
jgi:hypothetical protein